jgi:hypothetical protein
LRGRSRDRVCEHEGVWRDEGREEYDYDVEFGYSYARRNTGNMQVVHVVFRVWMERICGSS